MESKELALKNNLLFELDAPLGDYLAVIVIHDNLSGKTLTLREKFTLIEDIPIVD